MQKKKKPRVAVSLPGEFVDMIDEIVEKNPDFSNRVNVIRHAVRKYHDRLRELKKI
ncbi:MAG: ribbon-helix-helix domain-containing protein [Nanoarchaeota archaeon]|nr:ribbon-helix-helix domain-containing protein [Nanoarchaeota archaeon]